MAINAPASSSIDIRLPISPGDVDDPKVYDELNTIYSAIGNLQAVVTPLSNNMLPVVIGGTVDLPNMSGIIIVNNYTNGNAAIFLASNGATVVVASIGAQYGTLAYNATIKGYTWTNNYPTATATVALILIKTRNTT